MVSSGGIELEIITRRRTDHFTMLANDLLRCTDMTARARGVLMAMLSMRSGWRTTKARINRDCCPELGRTALDAVLTELRELGHLTVQKTRDPETGQFMWRWLVDAEPMTQFPGAGLPGDGNSVPGKPVPREGVDGPASAKSTTLDLPTPEYPYPGPPDAGAPYDGEPAPIRRTSSTKYLREKKPTPTAGAVGLDSSEPETRHAALIVDVRKLRPTWTTQDITAALEHPQVLEREMDTPGIARAALLALAADRDGKVYRVTRSPARLPYAGQWWIDAESVVAPRRPAAPSLLRLPRGRCGRSGCHNGKITVELHTRGDRVVACPDCDPDRHRAELAATRELADLQGLPDLLDFDDLVRFHQRVDQPETP